MVLRALQNPEDDQSGSEYAAQTTHNQASHLRGTSPVSNSKKRKARWSGIIGTGQSLSDGFGAPQTVTTKPAPGGLRLHDTAPNERYDIRHPEAENLTVVPLTEPLRWRENEDYYPANIWGRTPHWAMAGMVTEMIQQSKQGKESTPTSGEGGGDEDDDFFTVHSCVGIGGAPLGDICRHGNKNSYEASLFEARALTRLAKLHNATLTYDVILNTHGEADALLGNFEYGDQILKLLDDYTKSLKEITGQTNDPIMIHSQQNTMPFDNPPNPPVRANCGPVTQQQWTIQERSNNRIICAGPKYQYGYVDGLHLPRGGYDRLGEKYGQVYYQTVIQGKPFVPLSPTSANLADRMRIHCGFNVPVAPLNFDTLLPLPHQGGHLACWTNGKGFEVRDAVDEPVKIDDVQVNEDGISVSIFLSPDCSPSSDLRLPLTLGYAMAQDGEGALGGQAAGRMGLLRDSDATVGSTSKVLNCHLKGGWNDIYCPDDAFKDRALYDEVSAVQVGAFYEGYLVESDQENNKGKLDVPWLGNSGWHKLQFRHQQRNYCVSFVIDVEGDGTV